MTSCLISFLKMCFNLSHLPCPMSLPPRHEGLIGLFSPGAGLLGLVLKVLSLSLSTRFCAQMVNAKKLEKAEARLKAKQDKRMERDSVKSSGPL